MNEITYSVGSNFLFSFAILQSDNSVVTWRLGSDI